MVSQPLEVEVHKYLRSWKSTYVPSIIKQVDAWTLVFCVSSRFGGFLIYDLINDNCFLIVGI